MPLPFARRPTQTAPTFSRDFAGLKTLDHGVGPAITFTRASNATYFDANGTLQTATSGTPRFDHDPATGASRGLLIEEERTNLFQRSAEFDNAYWTKTGLLAFGSGSTADAIAAPDGTTSAELIVQNANNSAHNVNRSVGVTAGTAYTLSVFAKAKESTVLLLSMSAVGFTASTRCWYDLSTGAIGSTNGTPTATSIQNVGNGWYRCSISKTATADVSTEFNIVIAQSNGVAGSYTGDGTSGLYIWGAQLEAAAFPTSYIPTTSATATRAEERAEITSIGSFYNASEGTMFAEYSSITTLNQPAFTFDNSSEAERLLLHANASGIPTFFTASSNTTQASIGIGSAITANTVIKLAAAAKVDDFQAARGGTLGTADTSGVMPTVSRMMIGRRATAVPLSGHIRKVAYWPRRLSNTLLQQLTT